MRRLLRSTFLLSALAAWPADASSILMLKAHVDGASPSVVNADPPGNRGAPSMGANFPVAAGDAGVNDKKAIEEGAEGHLEALGMRGGLPANSRGGG